MTDHAAPIDLLIYDCDGVLVDSELLSNAVLAEMMSAAGYPLDVAGSLRVFAGQSLDDVVRTAERLLARDLGPQWGAAWQKAVLARFETDLRPVPGVAAAIEALAGSRCVASSSHPDRLWRALELTGLAPLFAPHVFSATAVARGKPAPDLFLHAAARMGVAPERALVIEDSDAGVAAARAAGMRVIGFAGASHAGPAHAARLAAAGCDAVVSAMADLPAAVARVGLRARVEEGT